MHPAFVFPCFAMHVHAFPHHGGNSACPVQMNLFLAVLKTKFAKAQTIFHAKAAAAAKSKKSRRNSLASFFTSVRSKVSEVSFLPASHAVLRWLVGVVPQPVHGLVGVALNHMISYQQQNDRECTISGQMCNCKRTKHWLQSVHMPPRSSTCPCPTAASRTSSVGCALARRSRPSGHRAA